MLVSSADCCTDFLFASIRSASFHQRRGAWNSADRSVGSWPVRTTVGRRRGRARIREIRRNRLHVDRMIVPGRRRWERRRSLDHRPVIFQPFAVVEGDRADDAAPPAIGGGEATLLDGTLRDHDLVAEGLHADALDVDAELARPEGGQREVRPAVGLEAHHVMRRDRGPEDRIVPVLQREKLVFVEHVRRACDVARDEYAVGHHTVDVKCAAAGVAGHAPEARGQAQPLPAIRCSGSTRATPPPRRRRS